MASDLFTRASVYVKKHPRTSFQDAIQLLKSKKTVSGPAKRKVKAPAKKAVSKPRETVKNISVKIGKVKSPTPKKKETILAKGKSIIKKIDKLEADRTAAKGKELKYLYAVEINKMHKKLKSLSK